MKKILTSMFLLSMIIGLSFGQVPTNGLVAYYPFNGNANDESGNGLNGTLMYGVSLTSDRFGVENSAYHFDGNGGYIDLPTANLSSSFSFSLWYKTTNVLLSQTLITNVSGSVTYSWDVSHRSDNTAKLWNCYNGFYSSSANFATNDIYVHLVVTYDGSAVKIYKNGVLDNTYNVTLDFTYSGLPIRVGYSNSGYMGNESFSGDIDDVAIYNRAVTQEEVTALFEGCNLSITTQPTDLTVDFTDDATFSLVSSDPTVTYQWQTNLGTGFEDITDAGQYSGATTNTLTVANTTMDNNNQLFRCVSKTPISCVDTSEIAKLTVNCTINITTNPVSQTINVGNNAQFFITSTNTNANFQWQTDLGFGFQNVSDAGQYSGTTTTTLNVSSVSTSNNNQKFRCVLTAGTCSDTSDIAVLTVTTVGVDEKIGLNQFILYPNPAKNQINVQVNAKQVGESYAICDQLGRTVMTGKLNKENSTIELSNLSIGIYVFKVGNNAVKSFKVINN